MDGVKLAEFRNLLTQIYDFVKSERIRFSYTFDDTLNGVYLFNFAIDTNYHREVISLNTMESPSVTASIIKARVMDWKKEIINKEKGETKMVNDGKKVALIEMFSAWANTKNLHFTYENLKEDRFNPNPSGIIVKFQLRDIDGHLPFQGTIRFDGIVPTNVYIAFQDITEKADRHFFNTWLKTNPLANRRVTYVDHRVPKIKNVIFNDPATIVFWEDNTKTVVKAANEDFDPEKGLAMAITKKALGNQGNYYNDIRKWVDKYYEENHMSVADILVKIGEAYNKAQEAYGKMLDSRITAINKIKGVKND